MQSRSWSNPLVNDRQYTPEISNKHANFWTVLQCYEFDMTNILIFEIQMFKYLFSYMFFCNQTSLSCSQLAGLYKKKLFERGGQLRSHILSVHLTA